MKVVILAGGFGTRISEESFLKPKPMVEIGGKPIIWHIMKYYSHFGYNEFVICCGYMQHVIKEWFADYYLHTSDVTFDFSKDGAMQVHTTYTEPWKVTLVDTGLNTMTGGRIKRVQKYIGDESFFLTYGDGVSTVDINALLDFHKKHGKIATLTAVNIGQQFGVIELDETGTIHKFREKNESDGSFINGGYMVLNPEIFDYLEGDETIFEQTPLTQLASEGQLKAFVHNGFWKCMDTTRDKKQLEELLATNNAPWKVWED